MRFFWNLFCNTRDVSITHTKSKMELLMTEEIHFRIFRFLWIQLFLNIAWVDIAGFFINIPYLDNASHEFLGSSPKWVHAKFLIKMLQICQIITKIFRDVWDSSTYILFFVRKMSQTEGLKRSQKSFRDIFIIKNLINSCCIQFAFY